MKLYYLRATLKSYLTFEHLPTIFLARSPFLRRNDSSTKSDSNSDFYFMDWEADIVKPMLVQSGEFENVQVIECMDLTEPQSERQSEPQAELKEQEQGQLTEQEQRQPTGLLKPIMLYHNPIREVIEKRLLEIGGLPWWERCQVHGFVDFGNVARMEQEPTRQTGGTSKMRQLNRA